MTWLSVTAALLACTGMLLSLAGLVAVRCFAARPRPHLQHYPGITILRPLCGDEPLLEEALVSCCRQAYPDFQIVFGVQDASDAALAVVERVRDRFPRCDITVVIDPTSHGPNPKVANLINMLPQARHEILVISDSDLQLSPNYLEQLLAELEKPGTGLVTALSVGLLPPDRSWLRQLGATQINHNFLPSVLISRMLGRQDCLGSTVMLRRETLDRAGGLGTLIHFLAEDNVLGRRVRALGLRVGLADTVALATVRESSVRALWLHEIRWTRTIRTVAPLSLAGTAIQYPLLWSLVAAMFSGGALWAVALFAASWLVRALCAREIDRALGHCTLQPVDRVSLWLLPLRDVLTVAEIAACFWINDVVWRGHRLAEKTASANAPIKAWVRSTATR